MKPEFRDSEAIFTLVATIAGHLMTCVLSPIAFRNCAPAPSSSQVEPPARTSVKVVWVSRRAALFVPRRAGVHVARVTSDSAVRPDRLYLPVSGPNLPYKMATSIQLGTVVIDAFVIGKKTGILSF